jgi:hypothetical protein
MFHKPLVPVFQLKVAIWVPLYWYSKLLRNRTVNDLPFRDPARSTFRRAQEFVSKTLLNPHEAAHGRMFTALAFVSTTMALTD